MAKKSNWSKARHRIDSGETHDKVDYPDPAAAPLGTDEEAGGATTAPENIRENIKRQQEQDADEESDYAKNPTKH